MATELLETSIDINAPAERVWAVVSDLKRMGEWSPQCRKLIVLGGAPKLGSRTINVNNQGKLWWPTSAKVVQFEPNKKIAYRIVENKTIWSFEITPTDTGVTLTERREAAGGKTTPLSAILVDKLLGGNDDFETGLRAGMQETLTKIKNATQR